MAKRTIVPQQSLNSPGLWPVALWIPLTVAKVSSTGPLDLLEQLFLIPWSTILIIMEDLVLTDHPTTNFSCCTHTKSLISHISLFHHPSYFFIYIKSISLHFLIPLFLHSLVLCASTVYFHGPFQIKTTSLWRHPSQKYTHQYAKRKNLIDAYICVCFHPSSSLLFILEGLLHCFYFITLGRSKCRTMLFS